MNDQEIYQKIEELIEAISRAKPNDRSDKDRRYAVVNTMMEKVLAYFSFYVMRE